MPISPNILTALYDNDPLLVALKLHPEDTPYNISVLCDALSNNTSLKHLDISNNELVITDHHARQLTQTTLVYLDISANEITQDAIIILANHPTLVNLKAQCLNLTPAAITALAQNTRLKSLSLDNNMIDDNTLLELAANNNITSLTMTNCDLSSSSPRILAENHTLCYLDLSVNRAILPNLLSFMKNTTLTTLILNNLTYDHSNAIIPRLHNHVEKNKINKIHQREENCFNVFCSFFNTRPARSFIAPMIGSFVVHSEKIAAEIATSAQQRSPLSFGLIDDLSAPINHHKC